MTKKMKNKEMLKQTEVVLKRQIQIFASKISKNNQFRVYFYKISSLKWKIPVGKKIKDDKNNWPQSEPK